MILQNLGWLQTVVFFVGAFVGAVLGNITAHKWLVRRDRATLRRLRRHLQKTLLSLQTTLIDVGLARREYLESEEAKRNDAV